MLGISSKSISSRKQIIEFAYLFAIISQYFWDILFHYLVNSFVVTSFLYSYNDSCHGDLGNIFQNLFGCLSHDWPKLLHSVQILIYKLTFNKHSRSFIQITNKNGRVGGLCVKVTCFVWRKEEGRGSCPEKQPLSSTIFCCYDHSWPRSSKITPPLLSYFSNKMQICFLKRALVIFMIFPFFSIYFERKILFLNNN